MSPPEGKKNTLGLGGQRFAPVWRREARDGCGHRVTCSSKHAAYEAFPMRYAPLEARRVLSHICM